MTQASASEARNFRKRSGFVGAGQRGQSVLRALKKASRDCDGSALVEATVVMPLLVSDGRKMAGQLVASPPEYAR
jgi:hypothetical protein